MSKLKSSCIVENAANRSLAIGLIRDFVDNRATDMALTQFLDASLQTGSHARLARHIKIWLEVNEHERRACLDILEDLLSQVRAQRNILESDLQSLKEYVLLQSS